MPNTQYWVLLSAQHITETYISPGGDLWNYEISPNYNLKKGDSVYLWSNISHGFFGWGEIAEPPRIFIESGKPDTKARQRQNVVIHRQREFDPPITVEMMQRNREVRKIIPVGFDDLYAIPLRPAQANYLNDLIKECGANPPPGSPTLNVFKDSPKLIKELGDFTEREKRLLSYHYVDRLPLEEIAGFWSLSVPTVKEELEIAVRKLLSFKDSVYLEQIARKALREHELPVSLIEVVETIKALTPDLIHHLKQNEDDFQKLKPKVFEHLVGELLFKQGFNEVQLVGQDANTSADILAIKKRGDNEEDIRCFIEVKRWKKKVGIEVVNQVLGAMVLERDDYGWNAAMIVSLLGEKNFRKTTPERLARYNLTLKKKNDLLNWLEDYEPKGNGLWLPTR